MVLTNIYVIRFNRYKKDMATAAKELGMARTPLYSLHLELDARMVCFADYMLPIHYPAGIRSEHVLTRTKAGLFDISHMGQLKLTGHNISVELEKLVPGNIQGLKPFHQAYTVMTNEDGGIIDDLMITRMHDHFFLVVNAACKNQDIQHLNDRLPSDIIVRILDNQALLAIQGPESAQILARYQPDIAKLDFLTAGEFQIRNIDCLIHRCGYTGEDGFEISVSAEQAEELARMLLTSDALMPAGLGARDSLRLEAGLCLYGHDLNEQTSPIEAGLASLIAGKYRSDPSVLAQFPGADNILRQLVDGPEKIRAGFRPDGKILVREGIDILDGEGSKAGIITSGGFGPTVGGPIAMGYINKQFISDSEYVVEIRNRTHKLVKVSLPFVKHRYYQY